MFSTTKRNVILLVAVCLALMTCATALSTNQQKGGKKTTSVTVTGCLQKGDEAGEFAITGEDGKNYELVSRTVKLSGHIGHKVSVTGTVAKEESEENEKKEAGEGWSGRIQVTSLKMVSETCK